jgi:hypothetical protein
MFVRNLMRLAVVVFAAGVTFAAWTGAQQTPDLGWLALCSKCLSPSITSLKGAGTAAAVAEGKITQKDAQGHCENWEPGDVAGCLKREYTPEEAKRVYRATADCTTGRIKPIDGESYTFAGVWDNSDIGEGRTKWRDAAGNIVGRDNASNGLGISQQWEVLCPGPLKASVTPAAAAKASVAAAKPAAGAPVAAARAAAPPAAARVAAAPAAQPVAAAQQIPNICGATPNCIEVVPFAATLTDFRHSVSGRRHLLDGGTC